MKNLFMQKKGRLQGTTNTRQTAKWFNPFAFVILPLQSVSQKGERHA
ncbi:MAG: hypothetical protein SPL79_08345 [Sphaerochaetaceae bacterium]|nr:hypothetical protein [Sphaerochaetaceae bacterium]